MTEEEINEEEEIEESIEEKSEEEIKEATEEKCDPTQMNCDELGKHIIGLVDKRSEYTTAIGKLDDVKKIMPSNTIQKLYDDTIKEKQKVDDEIYLVAERAIACRSLKPEQAEEETEEETE